MKNETLRRLLQLFAGEGAGGSGSASAGDGGSAAPASGATADAAGQQLRELGVPEEKIRRNRAIRARNGMSEAARNTAGQPAEAETQQAAAAAEDGKPTEEPAKARMTWDEIKADPEYNREMQKVVQAAKAKSKAAEEAMNALAPFLQGKLKEFGMDPEHPDYATLAKRMSGEYAQKAVELGVPEEIAQQLDVQQRTLEQQRNFRYFQQMEADAAKLKEVFPSFDLRSEMENPVFRRLTHPEGNIRMSVEDAFYAVHRQEIDAARAAAVQQQTSQQIANAIAAQGKRPNESGVSQQAPSVTSFDYSKASKEQRAELKAQIRAAAARGEKIYPGR